MSGAVVPAVGSHNAPTSSQFHSQDEVVIIVIIATIVIFINVNTTKKQKFAAQFKLCVELRAVCKIITRSE